MSDETFEDYNESSDEEFDDPVFENEMTDLESKSSYLSEKDKRRRIEDILEAKRLFRDLDEFDGDPEDFDFVYQDIMKELRQSE